MGSVERGWEGLRVVGRGWEGVEREMTDERRRDVRCEEFEGG